MQILCKFRLIMHISTDLCKIPLIMLIKHVYACFSLNPSLCTPHPTPRTRPHEPPCPRPPVPTCPPSCPPTIPPTPQPPILRTPEPPTPQTHPGRGLSLNQAQRLVEHHMADDAVRVHINRDADFQQQHSLKSQAEEAS